MVGQHLVVILVEFFLFYLFIYLRGGELMSFYSNILSLIQVVVYFFIISHLQCNRGTFLFSLVILRF